MFLLNILIIFFANSASSALTTTSPQEVAMKEISSPVLQTLQKMASHGEAVIALKGQLKALKDENSTLKMELQTKDLLRQTQGYETLLAKQQKTEEDLAKIKKKRANIEAIYDEYGKEYLAKKDKLAHKAREQYKKFESELDRTFKVLLVEAEYAKNEAIAEKDLLESMNEQQDKEKQKYITNTDLFFKIRALQNDLPLPDGYMSFFEDIEPLAKELSVWPIILSTVMHSKKPKMSYALRAVMEKISSSVGPILTQEQRGKLLELNDSNSTISVEFMKKQYQKTLDRHSEYITQQREYAEKTYITTIRDYVFYKVWRKLRTNKGVPRPKARELAVIFSDEIKEKLEDDAPYYFDIQGIKQKIDEYVNQYNFEEGH